jgi:hypothetical protein
MKGRAMKDAARSRLRFVGAGLLAAAGLSGCSGGGINAGVDGGLAFIAFAATLVLTVVILYIALGRDD